MTINRENTYSSVEYLEGLLLRSSGFFLKYLSTLDRVERSGSLKEGGMVRCIWLSIRIWAPFLFLF
jgi:hypothetical protein